MVLAGGALVAVTLPLVGGVFAEPLVGGVFAEPLVGDGEGLASEAASPGRGVNQITCGASCVSMSVPRGPPMRPPVPK
jgi:hypothetical protein